jgi:hypothetical protein
MNKLKRTCQWVIPQTVFLLLGSTVAFAEDLIVIGPVYNQGSFNFWEVVMISLGTIFLLAARPLSDGLLPKADPKEARVEAEPKVETKPKVDPEPKAEAGTKVIGSPAATLTLEAGGQLGKSYPIGEKGLILGRDPEQCDIIISDPNVSRVHAWVTLKREGAVVIDRGSTNGTYINNIKVENAKLKSGDVIQLGRKCMTTLVFKQ